jgi:succinate dehydrogenase / fumarate reductase, iron-sulfur subunit
MQVQFKIQRQHPSRPAWIQNFTLEIEPGATILDSLNRIKWEQDGSLAFRKNCRNTICGSCAVRVGDRAILACKESVGKEISRAAAVAPLPADEIPTLEITPLGNMPVIKDLVVDMQSFWSNLKAVEPYISTAARQVPEREFLQSPSDRAKLDQTGNCILCGACYSDCNAREVNPTFVGPHALAKAYRTLADSRDQATAQRLEKYSAETAGVWGCTRCFNCNAVCPMEVAPLDQINRIKGEILAQPQSQPARSLRHRQVMVDLVKQGGWIDERQFGLRVVGNNFRDLSGLLSLLPLGLRMLKRGKLPLNFEPSDDTATVRSLITAVQTQNPSSESLPSPMTEPQSTPSADLKPKSVEDVKPKTSPDDVASEFVGWTPYAEQTNGRFAMIGILALLLLELISGQDFFSWIGWR